MSLLEQQLQEHLDLDFPANTYLEELLNNFYADSSEYNWFRLGEALDKCNIEAEEEWVMVSVHEIIIKGIF
jgi:hypothetical protein